MVVKGQVKSGKKVRLWIATILGLFIGLGMSLCVALENPLLFTFSFISLALWALLFGLIIGE